MNRLSTHSGWIADNVITPHERLQRPARHRQQCQRRALADFQRVLNFVSGAAQSVSNLEVVCATLVVPVTAGVPLLRRTRRTT